MKSILSKVWLSLTILVIIILGVVWAFQTIFLEKYYIRERVNLLLDNGRKLQSNLEKIDITKIHETQLINDIQILSNQYGLNIELFNRNQDLLLATGNFGGRGMSQGMAMMRLDISSIYTGKTIISQIKHPRLNTSMLMIGLPIRQDNKVIGALVIISPIASIKEASSVLQSNLSVIMLISMILASIFAYFLSKRITKPIININSVANKISAGDYNTRLKIKSNDEIGMLSNTMNSLAEQLGKVENLRREFIANVSHELKTPLGLIRGYTELIEDNLDENSLRKNKKSIDIISDETMRLDKIVQDMLLLSQIETGFVKLELSDFNLNELIFEIINKFSFIINEKGINIDFISESEEVVVNADREKISQVLINLISNAIQYSNKDIQIIIEKVDNKAKISVRDYGRGISQEDLPYVWDRFYKVNKSRSHEENGTGLGMSIVKNILLIHNAEFGIESKLGEGTTVWFVL